MKLACSTRSFPEDRLQMALAKVQWAGFLAAELDLSGEPLPPEEELHRSLQANGLEVAAVDAGPLPPSSPATPALDDAALAVVAHVGRAAAMARAVDGSVVVVSAAAGDSLDGIVRSLDLLKAALGAVEVDLCLVNRRGTPVETREALRELWRLTAERDTTRPFRLALDPAEAALAGWDPLDMDALPELPRHVYLVDASGGRRVPPGEGDLNWPAITAGLSQRGYAGSLSLILENADPWAVEPIVREVRELASGWPGF